MIIVRDHDFLLASRRARLRAACNHFKHLVLAGSHVPNRLQTKVLLDKLAETGCDFPDSTWKSWFSEKAPIPQASKVERLDQCMLVLKQKYQSTNADSRYWRYVENGYFSDFLDGGLMAQLLSPTSSSDPVVLLMARAQQYQPKSPLHLHFDAIDASAWGDDVLGLSWSVVATIAADRVLQLLWERWSPRAGSLFPTLMSNLRLRWVSSNEAERKQIEDDYARLNPGLFQRLMDEVAQPDWFKCGVSPDIAHEHVYKLLFALAADPDFLVQDRLQAWALDLATSALAMHAMAWTRRYEAMGLGMTPEKQYWWAFNSIFFEPEAFEEVDDAGIVIAMGKWPADWSQASIQAFSNARNVYWAELEDIGIEPSEVRAGLMKTRERHPMIFYSSHVAAADPTAR